MSHVLVGFKSNLDWNLKLHVTPTWYIPYCKQIFIYSHATFHFIMLPAEMHFLQFNRIEPQGTSPQRHHNWTLQATSCLNAIYQDFSLLYIFTFLCFFALLSSTMLPPLPRRKIILYLPFLHEEYSMAIHTELHKTAISSSSLYFSTLVINIVFSCLSLCRRHQHFLCPSTHRHLQHTISSLQSHCLYYV